MVCIRARVQTGGPGKATPVHYHLAKALAEVGEPRRAAAHYEIAKKIDPQFVATNEESEKVHQYFMNQQKKD